MKINVPLIKAIKLSIRYKLLTLLFLNWWSSFKTFFCNKGSNRQSFPKTRRHGRILNNSMPETASHSLFARNISVFFYVEVNKIQFVISIVYNFEIISNKCFSDITDCRSLLYKTDGWIISSDMLFASS